MRHKITVIRRVVSTLLRKHREEYFWEETHLPLGSLGIHGFQRFEKSNKLNIFDLWVDRQMGLFL